MISLADQIRDVPEIAVRLYLGAKVAQDNGTTVVALDGKEFRISSDVYEKAQGVVRALSIQERRVEYASDVLELRHAAEDIFLRELHKANSDLPTVLFVPAGDIATGYYRAMIPASILTENDLVLAHHTDRLDLKKALLYDILWIQLDASSVGLSIAKAAKEAGVKLVYETDDRFDAIPDNNPSSVIYTKERIANVWKMIEMADLVTVTTRNLADHIAKRNPNVLVLPNMPVLSLWPKAIPPRNDGTVRIIWAGSPTHSEDLAVVAPALREILSREKGKVRFTCFGEQLSEELSPVRDFIDLVPFVSFEEYPEKLASIEADLAIAPLADTAFNQGKSAVKYLEYSACSWPSFLSPVGEYKELVHEQNAPAVLVGDGAWKAVLGSAIEDIRGKGTIRKMGALANTWAKANRCILQAKAKPWLDAIHTLVEAK